MTLTALWLPIILSAVLVFVASSLVHMLLKWHNSDYRPLPNEDAVRDVVRTASLLPGQYFMPHCTDHKQLRLPEVQKKFVDGPVAMLTVRANGVPTVGPSMAQWFALSVVISAFAACVAAMGVGAGAPASTVFWMTAVTSFMAHGLGSPREAIWMGKPWSVTVKELLDAVIYAAVTGGTFAALWPR